MENWRRCTDKARPLLASFMKGPLRKDQEPTRRSGSLDSRDKCLFGVRRRRRQLQLSEVSRRRRRGLSNKALCRLSQPARRTERRTSHLDRSPPPPRCPWPSLPPSASPRRKQPSSNSREIMPRPRPPSRGPVYIMPDPAAVVACGFLLSSFNIQ